MKISETFQYPGATVERVYELITDAAFREEAVVAGGALEQDVTVEGGNVTIVRTQPSDMPDFVMKLTGPTAKVKQTEQWSEPDADGNRTADIKVSIIGQPAEMVGKAYIRNTDSDPEFTVEGDVKVSIPFLGKKIEPEVAKAIIASLKQDVELGVERL